MTNREQEDLHMSQLVAMFDGVEVSTILKTLRSNKGDMEKTTDELLKLQEKRMKVKKTKSFSLFCNLQKIFQETERLLQQRPTPKQKGIEKQKELEKKQQEKEKQESERLEKLEKEKIEKEKSMKEKLENHRTR